MSKILKLTLHKKAFEVMVTGEKDIEYRNPSNWILSRLLDKNGDDRKYDFIEFTNGYGKNKPRFRCEYINWLNPKSNKSKVLKYSNGLTVNVVPGMIWIFLGNIVETFNCPTKTSVQQQFIETSQQ